MPSQQQILVGFEITAEMRQAFDACPDKDRVYLEDPAHLERVKVDGAEYIGKVVKSGIAVDRLEDTARSVVSLLGRVAPQLETRSNRALIVAAENEPKTGVLDPDPTTSPDGEGFDYSELV